MSSSILYGFRKTSDSYTVNKVTSSSPSSKTSSNSKVMISDMENNDYDDNNQMKHRSSMMMIKTIDVEPSSIRHPNIHHHHLHVKQSNIDDDLNNKRQLLSSSMSTTYASSTSNYSSSSPLSSSSSDSSSSTCEDFSNRQDDSDRDDIENQTMNNNNNLNKQYQTKFTVPQQKPKQSPDEIIGDKIIEKTKILHDNHNNKSVMRKEKLSSSSSPKSASIGLTISSSKNNSAFEPDDDIEQLKNDQSNIKQNRLKNPIHIGALSSSSKTPFSQPKTDNCFVSLYVNNKRCLVMYNREYLAFEPELMSKKLDNQTSTTLGNNNGMFKKNQLNLFVCL